MNLSAFCGLALEGLEGVGSWGSAHGTWEGQGMETHRSRILGSNVGHIMTWGQLASLWCYRVKQ